MGYQSEINKIVAAGAAVKTASAKQQVDMEKLAIQKQNADTQAKYAETMQQKLENEKLKYQVKEHELNVKETQNKLISMQEKAKQKAQNVMLANIKQVKDLKEQRRLLRQFNKDWRDASGN